MLRFDVSHEILRAGGPPELSGAALIAGQTALLRLPATAASAT